MKVDQTIWSRRFVLLFIANVLVLAAFYAFIPLIPLYCQEIGITGPKVGIVLTAMSLTTVLFRPFAGYALDSFNRYRVYLLSLALFSLAFPGFVLLPFFWALVLMRLLMGAAYSVCGSGIMTLAGDVLPPGKVTEGISRFALTVSVGMALGPYLGIRIQEGMSSTTAFLALFALLLIALACVLGCGMKYPKVERRRFSLGDSIHAPSLPFMLNMMFLMIPYGAVIAYSSILAQQDGLMTFLPYFYVVLVAGMLTSKLTTQRMVDAGRHRALVYGSLAILALTMSSFAFLETGVHLLAAGYLFGVGYGILQPLFQSFVTGTAPAEKRGAANATYLLSYDIGIGIGVLMMGFLQEGVGLHIGFALTAVAYVIGGVVYAAYVEGYYRRLKDGVTRAGRS